MFISYLSNRKIILKCGNIFSLAKKLIRALFKDLVYVRLYI
jgi:hypothetical protein